MTTACAADLPAGCRELGFLLRDTPGREGDARDAFTKACKLGDSEACGVIADPTAEAPPVTP